MFTYHFLRKKIRKAFLRKNSSEEKFLRTFFLREKQIRIFSRKKNIMKKCNESLFP